MTIVSRPQKQLPVLLLGVLLLVAQSLAVAHAYQHELGSPVDATCASCVIGGQLSGGCVDNAAGHVLSVPAARHDVDHRYALPNAVLPAPHQRGPPA